MPLMTDPSLTLRSVIGGMLDEAYMPLTIKINFISQVDFTYREQPIGIVGTLESHGLFVSICQLIQDMHSQDMVCTTTSCCFHNQENKVLFFHVLTHSRYPGSLLRGSFVACTECQLPHVPCRIAALQRRSVPLDSGQ